MSFITLPPRAVRQNGQDIGSAPPSRPRSTFRKGSGEAEPYFRSLVQAVEDMYPTATSEPAQVAEESDRHHGERCTSPERDGRERERCTPLERIKHDGERCASPERDGLGHDGERCAPTGRGEHDGERDAPPERTKHGGERCASPEPQFGCDGWCRKTMPKMATLDHPDVVRWAFDCPSIPSHLLPWFSQISISSSNDGQVSWDAITRNGGSISMTTVR